MRAVRNLITKLQETPPKEKEKIDNFHVTSSTGTEIFGGEFFEEYLQEIRGNEWAKIADRMRRSSDQVNMLLTLIKTPIINATWEIESPDESEISNEIKEFLEFALFDNIDFEQFIQEALTFYEFGHSVFEVVYTPLINHAKHSNTIIPKKFSFISPKTIEEWRLNNDGSINHIRQMVDGDLSRDVRIEADNLMVMSINKEGSNYEGRSLLRPIYGNWKRKQNFLKILAIGIERSSLGVPVGITAQSAGSKARDTLQKILNAVTTHQRSSIVVPHGTDVKNFSISFDADKVEKVIEAERRGMSQSFLAGFMELGTNSGGTGSYALSSNLSNIFFSSLDTPANIIAKKLNGIIKDLIDFNYGKQELYHKIRVSNISDKLGKEFVENLTMLTQSGYVSATDTMKEYLRKKFNLPESDLEEEENILETEIDLIEENNTNFTNKEKRSNILDFAQSTSASKLITSQKEELQELMITELTKRRDKLLENTRVILNNNKTQNRRKEVVNQSIPGSRQYKKDILNFLVELSATATKQVLSEIKLPKAEFADKKDLETLTPNTKKRLETEIDLIVKTQESDLEKNTYFAFNNNVDNTDSTEALLQQMKEGSDTYINGPSIEVGAANFTSNAVNNARNDVYQSKEILDEMESFTIVNPSPEAAICKELAGRTITKEQYINGDLPPYHHNCNTIVVANVKGAKGNPKINPLGLSFTGTEEQVKKIIKSNTL